MTNRTHNRGFSIVELMIAMTLGLLMVAAITTVFLTGNRNFIQDDRFSRMQENGRYAIKVLSQELSMADFWGGVIVPSNIVNNIGAASDCGVTFLGTDALRFMPAATNTAVSAIYPCLSAADRNDGTGVMMVKRVFGGNDTVLSAGAYYLKTNLITSSFVPGTDTYDASFRYWEFVPRIYYIRPFSRTAGDGIPGLHRRTLQSVSGAPTLASEASILAEGIETFHIEFGIDADTDGYANKYTSAPTAAEMPAVVNARLHVLVRSADRDTGHTDNKTYTLGDVCYNVGGQNGCTALLGTDPQQFYRRVFTETVALRNPVTIAQFAP